MGLGGVGMGHGFGAASKQEKADDQQIELPDPHLAELSYHFYEAGSPKAVDYASRAGAWAVAQHREEEAGRQ